MDIKYITKYQIYDKDTGNEVYDSYYTLQSAEYMVTNYYPNGIIVEVEVECSPS